MKVDIKDISQCVKELTITIEATEALQDYHKTLSKFKNFVAIPGFRKGKAPLTMIERTYGDKVKEEYFNQKLNDYYKQALEENDLHPINPGEAKEIEWEKGQDLVMVFTFEVMPQIKVEKYKGLKIPFEPTKFKDAMIDETIEDFRHKTATEETVETSEINDQISVTIKFLDDEGKETKQINRQFILGDNSYSKIMNKNLTGVKVGDEIKTKLFTKSEESTDSEITDNLKDREFLVEVKEIKRKVLPELNDDFAKDLEYDSLEILREKIAEELKIKIEKDNGERKRQAISTALIQENPFDLPPSFVKSYAEDLAKPYAEAYKMELDKIVPIYETIAAFNLKNHYLLDELKKLEKIEISDEDKEAMIAEAAENLKLDVAKYKEMYKKQIESDDFKYSLEEKKLMDFLEKNSKFVSYPKEDKKKISKQDKTKEKTESGKAE
ncbi:MAG: trigger factor [Candidatus Cloacimonadales bacterium]|nr:trigger factor [Candidatus Cloacimonadales bacterium]